MARRCRPSANVPTSVSVLSLQEGLNGGLGFASQPSRIYMFDPATALRRAQYYSIDGFSGSGIIAKNKSDGSVVVVGVHVATHGNSEAVPPFKRKWDGEIDIESISTSTDAIIQNQHCLQSYCFICIVSLVTDVMEAISLDVESYGITCKS